MSPPQTRHVDLLHIFDELNNSYFKDNKCCAGIGWRNIRIGKKELTMGICETTERKIRINTVLSDVRVPLWFIEFIVYHEMLHVVVGLEHDEPFLEREREFPHYEEALDFIEDKILAIAEEHRIERAEKRKRNNTP